MVGIFGGNMLCSFLSEEPTVSFGGKMVGEGFEVADN